MISYQRWLSLLLLVILPLVPLYANAPSAAAWQAKVDPWVLERMDGETVEFLVGMKEKADLRSAIQRGPGVDRGIFVVQQLSDTAAASQASLLDTLKAFKRQGVQVEYRPYWIVNAIWVRGNAAILQALSQRADVEHIYANPVIHLDLPEQPVGPVPALSQRPAAAEWNLTMVNAPDVWTLGYTGQGVVIGGQDTGYDWEHPALKSSYRGWDGTTASHDYNWYDAIHSGGGSCGPDSPEPCDDGTHGTHTMGIMVGDDDGENQIGMAPGARWIGCRNMDQGNGTPETYIACYQFFAAPTDLNGNNPRPDLAPDVINNSWACPAGEGCTDPEILHAAVQNVRAAGILTVHSAGNEGMACGSVQNPAAIYEESFSVGATTAADTIVNFSSRGPVLVDGSLRLKPNVSAPGSGVRSSIPGGGYQLLSGTSMAAPHVAGLVALVLDARPDLAGQVDVLESLIEQSAIAMTTTETCGDIPGSQVPNNTFGWGRINALATVQSALALPAPTIQINQTTDTVGYYPGQVFTYTFSVSRSNPEYILHSIIITDVLPAQTTFINATFPYTLTGDTVVWSIPEWPVNQPLSVALTVQVNADAAGAIINQVYLADSAETEPAIGPPVTLQRFLEYWLPMIFRLLEE